jgi:hypothetical protein
VISENKRLLNFKAALAFSSPLSIWLLQISKPIFASKICFREIYAL